MVNIHGVNSLLFLDLVYILFDNKAVLPKLEEQMKQQGHLYGSYLNSLKEKTVHSSNTLYAQELKMLAALTKSIDEPPFNTINWGKKQAITQIAHYSDLRHDNVLYNDECYGVFDGCNYPDLMVEPSFRNFGRKCWC